MERYVVGMDIGSTNIKALVLGEDGSIAAEASRPVTPIAVGKDGQEQDALDWWQQASAVFRELSEKAGPEIVAGISGVCVSSHTVSLLPLDENGIPVRNAIMYQDSRSADELSKILRHIGRDHFIRIVGGQPATAFLPGKLLWYRNHEPENFRRTKFYLQASSYINYKLTGRMTTDLDQAIRTQCFDSTRMVWSDEIGGEIRVDLQNVMPELKKPQEIIGVVTYDAEEETGLRCGIPVLAGCSDAMASMLATGMSRLGDAGESSGTSSLVFVGSAEQSRQDIPVVTRPCPVDGIPYIFDAPITTTGAALKWYINNFAGEEKELAAAEGVSVYSLLNELALQAAPGSGGLFFYPYLMGERAPLWNNYARGMFIGMGMNTTRSEYIRSVFEGTSYAIRTVMDVIRDAGGQADCLRVCGGGAKSRTWSMVKASVLNMPVYVMDEVSGNVPVGDALLAGHATGLFPDMCEASKKIIKVKEIIQPDPDWVRIYDRLYPVYKEMYAKLDDSLARIQTIVA